MNLNKYQKKFLNAYIEGKLHPAEELLALANAYKKSKALRQAAIFTETDQRFKHLLPIRYKESARHFKYMESRADENFGNKRKTFIYNQLFKADHLKA